MNHAVAVFGSTRSLKVTVTVLLAEATAETSVGGVVSRTTVKVATALVIEPETPDTVTE